MATGGGLEDASDEVVSHPCIVCENNNISTVFCAYCKHYHCGKCVDFHKTVPVLDEDEIFPHNDGDDRELQSVFTSKCDEHTNDIIDMYCKDHDVVGCTKCMMIDHIGNCKGLHDILRFVHGDPNIVPEFIQTVENIETELKEHLQRFHQEQEQLQQNKKDVISNIETIRDKIINIIRQQTENAVQKVEEQYDELNNKLKNKVTYLSNEVDKIVKLLENINLVSHDVPQSFVLAKKSKDFVSKAARVNNDMKYVTLSKRLAFCMDNLYENILTCEISDLGNVIMTPWLYRFSKAKDNFGGSDNVYDLCYTADGSVFITSDVSKMLHRICHKKSKIVEKLELPSFSRGVCCVSNTTVAVNCGKTIQLIDITGKLKLTDCIAVGQNTHGLYYYDDIFYVTSFDSVYKYDKNGKLLKTYCKYPDGNSIFSDIYNIVVNPVNKHIHVTDSNNGVITMNQEGHVLNVLKDKSSLPHGICVDQFGQVFVSGYFTNNIIQLNCDGRYITTVISDGLNRPQGICFDTSRGRFYIGCNRGRCKVYKVEKSEK
ncbi:hypothetical protein ACF0H5_019789 [Mactra antiquata]